MRAWLLKYIRTALLRLLFGNPVKLPAVANSVPLVSAETALPKAPQPLTGQIDPYSPTWRFVRAWAESSLMKARERNDNVNKDATQTAALRGEIRILKELIALPEPKRGLLVKPDSESEVGGY